MKYLSQWVTLLLAGIAIAGVYFYVTHAVEAQKNRIQTPRPKAPEQAVELSTTTTTTGRYTATITASGLVKPRYSLTMTSQVSGEVIRLSEQFEPGQVVKKGHILGQLQNRELNSSVASAKNTLAAAELALKEEIRQGEQARAEWEAAGFTDEPDSDLVLRAPQLAAAKTEVEAAKAALTNAQSKLEHSKLIAPFDALIVARNISPGSYLSAGSDIATLYSTDRADIQLDLSNSDWLKLPDSRTLLEKSWPVLISSIDANDTWQGKVLSIHQHINETTRMRSLTISLNNPLGQTPALIPGAFVNVSIQGKPLDNLWRLPNTALSQKSEIWYLDENSRLAAFETTPRLVDSQYVYIQVPEAMREKTVQVVVQPYNSYVKGTLAKTLNASTTPSKGAKP
ncbi:efflux RND transporter periplasmic adaptor subunit [Marinomonas sp. M1K-6]|uniref:Efflux RND transporter periplasmic adaptor subunit n=1 Tax=Marinomonas profundi TaxID=2726122 RepID=A0A847R9G4_9GAMM|nr:efflux RND transporter periplasmic adaptor subunit [Marinomonas profundi]NLQ16880.1 efflux RND transporter periplasmic adaptor subunit [Marinomonas profundi]UDV02612.1 efflux RND transporter periplasmic adaptor subunit [Marinomonas profundi]